MVFAVKYCYNVPSPLNRSVSVPGSSPVVFTRDTETQASQFTCLLHPSFFVLFFQLTFTIPCCALRPVLLAFIHHSFKCAISWMIYATLVRTISLTKGTMFITPCYHMLNISVSKTFTFDNSLSHVIIYLGISLNLLNCRTYTCAFRFTESSFGNFVLPCVPLQAFKTWVELHWAKL